MTQSCNTVHQSFRLWIHLQKVANFSDMAYMLSTQMDSFTASTTSVRSISSTHPLPRSKRSAMSAVMHARHWSARNAMHMHTAWTNAIMSAQSAKKSTRFQIVHMRDLWQWPQQTSATRIGHAAWSQLGTHWQCTLHHAQDTRWYVTTVSTSSVWRVHLTSAAAIQSLDLVSFAGSCAALLGRRRKVRKYVWRSYPSFSGLSSASSSPSLQAFYAVFKHGPSTPVTSSVPCSNGFGDQTMTKNWDAGRTLPEKYSSSYSLQFSWFCTKLACALVSQQHVSSLVSWFHGSWPVAGLSLSTSCANWTTFGWQKMM